MGLRRALLLLLACSSLADDAPPLGRRRKRRLAALRTPCAASCGDHGTCNEHTGTCSCQPGWVGAACEVEAHPACALEPPRALTISELVTRRPAPRLRVPCAGLRKLAPVACACIAQCLGDGEEVCGPGSTGCGYAWRQGPRHKPFGAQQLQQRLSSRDGFHASLPCVVTPPGAAAAVDSVPLL